MEGKLVIPEFPPEKLNLRTSDETRWCVSRNVCTLGMIWPHSRLRSFGVAAVAISQLARPLEGRGSEVLKLLGKRSIHNPGSSASTVACRAARD